MHGAVRTGQETAAAALRVLCAEVTPAVDFLGGEVSASRGYPTLTKTRWSLCADTKCGKWRRLPLTTETEGEGKGKLKAGGEDDFIATKERIEMDDEKEKRTTKTWRCADAAPWHFGLSLDGCDAPQEPYENDDDDDGDDEDGNAKPPKQWQPKLVTQWNDWVVDVAARWEALHHDDEGTKKELKATKSADRTKRRKNRAEESASVGDVPAASDDQSQHVTPPLFATAGALALLEYSNPGYRPGVTQRDNTSYGQTVSTSFGTAGTLAQQTTERAARSALTNKTWYGQPVSRNSGRGEGPRPPHETTRTAGLFGSVVVPFFRTAASAFLLPGAAQSLGQTVSASASFGQPVSASQRSYGQTVPRQLLPPRPTQRVVPNPPHTCFSG